MAVSCLRVTEDFLVALGNVSKMGDWASLELLEIQSKIGQVLKSDSSAVTEATLDLLRSEKPALQKKVEGLVQQCYKDIHTALINEAVEIFENVFCGEQQWAQFEEKYQDTCRFEVLYALYHDVVERRRREKLQMMIIVVVQGHESLFLEAIHFEFNSQVPNHPTCQHSSPA
eukprot:c15589_g1_i3.p1 GENE.c15589_g1_i3~~c15589_g1_i3.p1  ORF type:complete len:184 (+),score=48.27 c15589_g1_i3:37-552(+)